MLIFVKVLGLLALLGRVEPFKLSLRSPANQPDGFYQPPPPLLLPASPLPPPPSSTAQTYSEQSYYTQQHPIKELEPPSPPAGIKGGAAPVEEHPPAYTRPQMPYYPLPQQQALAYVIIRPIQPPQYQYLEPFRFNNELQSLPSFQHTEQQTINVQESHPIKGGPEPQLLPVADVPPPPPAGKGRFSRLRGSFDKFFSSAKSKITESLGTSYHVAGEEFVQPVALPPPPPPPAAPLPGKTVQQVEQQREEPPLTQQQEQESFKETEQQQPEKELPQLQQQKLEKEPLAQQKIEDSFAEQAKEFRREQTRLGGQQYAFAQTQIKSEAGKLAPASKSQAAF